MTAFDRLRVSSTAATSRTDATATCPTTSTLRALTVRCESPARPESPRSAPAAGVRRPWNAGASPKIKPLTSAIADVNADDGPVDARVEQSRLLGREE